MRRIANRAMCVLLSCLYASAYHNIRLGIALYSTIYAYGSVYPSCFGVCDMFAYVLLAGIRHIRLFFSNVRQYTHIRVCDMCVHIRQAHPYLLAMGCTHLDGDGCCHLPAPALAHAPGCYERGSPRAEAALPLSASVLFVTKVADDQVLVRAAAQHSS